MKLVTRDAYESDYAHSGRLIIENCDLSRFAGSFYILRIGSVDVDDSFRPILGHKLEIPPKSTVNLWTLESFVLDVGLIGFLGPTTDLLRQGLRLEHSPFIDPGFPGLDSSSGGALWVALTNLTSNSRVVEANAPLGKVTFFDLDLSLSDATSLASGPSSKSEKWAERREVGGKMTRAYEEYVEAVGRTFPADQQYLANPEYFVTDGLEDDERPS